MDEGKAATSTSDDVDKLEQTCSSSRHIIRRRRARFRMVQNVLLIWLDSNIDLENNEVHRDIITHLRRVVNTINTFTNVNQCVNFLKDISDEKVFMIVSDTFCRDTVPEIHPLAQLHAIFIFSKNKSKDEEWTKEWSKIKGVFSQIAPICEVLEQITQQCEQNAIPISFMTSNDVSNKNLNELNSSFMYTQILKEILLTIEFEEKHIKDFCDYYHAMLVNNKDALNKLNALQREYRNHTPIWWYTSECFLYSILNRALRLMDVDIIIKMGFFIGDLHRHIEQLHSEQFSGRHSDDSFTVYRGQGLSKTDFDQLIKTKGGLMSFNNFLSTSKDRSVSFAFSESNRNDPDLVGILFVMTIDPSMSSIPFATIDRFGYFQEENEVLFSMHTVFRIQDIGAIGTLYQVDLILTSDNDKDLQVLAERMREETYLGEEGWYRLGLLLVQMGESGKAQQIYEVLLGQTTDDSKKAPIYSQLGRIKSTQGEFEDAIVFYEKALYMYQKVCRPYHPDLTMTYKNIGVVYYNMGEYSKAFSYYEKALDIRQQLLPTEDLELSASQNVMTDSNVNTSEYSQALSSHEKSLEIQQQPIPPKHSDMADFDSNIDAASPKTNEHSKALSYYEKDLEMCQKSLPPNHPDLAVSYSNIGNVYYSMGEYAKALSYNEQALEIREKILPLHHPDLVVSYNNTGLTYNDMGEYLKALSCYEAALEIRQKSLPPNHIDLASSFNNIGFVYDNLSEYSKALLYYEKALEIRQKSRPSNHPDLAISYNNIGVVYRNIGEYSKALSYYEKALEIKQKALSPHHPSLASSYNNIGLLYDNIGEYPKALSYYTKSLEIRQKSLPPNHPDLAASYNNIGVVYRNICEYSKARSSYEKALSIQQQSLPPNHPDLASSYNNIGLVYYNMDDYSKALSSYEKALSIQQQSLPPNHPDLSTTYNNIGLMYYNMTNYSKALSYLERAVEIAQHSLPSNHPNLQGLRQNLESVKKKL